MGVLEAMLHRLRNLMRNASSYELDGDAMLDTAQYTRERDAARSGPPDGPSTSHLLIAVDETPGARRTLASGLAWAAAREAEVTVVHVVAPRRWRVGRFGPVRAVPMRVRDPLASSVLRDARRLGFAHGIVPRLALIASDDVDEVILGLAGRVSADAIVVGASRPDGLAAPLGVCQGVLRRASVPVVVVPA
jgi:nucleotide-binding universal stress UspA family protein